MKLRFHENEGKREAAHNFKFKFESDSENNNLRIYDGPNPNENLPYKLYFEKYKKQYIKRCKTNKYFDKEFEKFATNCI